MSEARYQQVQGVVGQMKAYSDLCNTIRSTSVDAGEPHMEAGDLLDEIEGYPRFPTGIEEIDRVNGGIHGCTLLAGEKGCGKSMLAMAIALYAAEQGHCVVYFGAENGDGLQRERIRRWYGAHDFVMRFARIAGVNFHHVRVKRGHVMRQIAETAVECSNDTHTGMLLVFDSTDAIVRKLLRSGENEFERKAQMIGWLDDLSIATDGKVCTLAISELSKTGESRGRTAAYTATVEITMRKEPPQPEKVRLTIEKDRDGKSDVDLGCFLRDWGRNTFLPWDPKWDFQP